VPVRFTVSAGGGTIAAAEAVTDAGGLASCGRWTLGAAGENAVTAAAEGVALPATVVATARRR
jgi:hypothetical protein